MNSLSCNLPLAVAPMIDWTNTHFRVLMRILAPHALLYTAMEPVRAVMLRKPKAIYFTENEHPLALQLGGCDSKELAIAVKIAEDCNFDEVNLNLGCPSPRVKSGKFGAILMRDGKHVADCIYAMKMAAKIPISVKMRTGVDELDNDCYLKHLVHLFVDAGVDKIIIHARKAWLNGLSPKENRTLPPLNYEMVYKLREHFPKLNLVLNGQINDINTIESAMKYVNGVMIGRLFCNSPYAITVMHKFFYPEISLLTRKNAIEKYLDYAYEQAMQGVRLSILCKPIMNMAHGLYFAKKWKQGIIKTIQQQDSKLVFIRELISLYDQN